MSSDVLMGSFSHATRRERREKLGGDPMSLDTLKILAGLARARARLLEELPL